MMSFEQQDHWSAAMLHMRLALELLDSAEAPALIGARLDQAIEALQTELNRSGVVRPLSQRRRLGS
jgi:hypothetical protein